MKFVAKAGFGLIALACLTGTALANPKTNLLHQWATGSDAAAIAKLGEMFTAAGGEWQQTAIAGHTANTLAKLRADVIAGNAPPAVQLKGPEIAEWNDTGGTANMDELADQEGWDKVVAPELLPVMKPKGNWVAAPMNIHRINWMWGNKSGRWTRPASPSCRRPGTNSTPIATRSSPPASSASSHLSAGLDRRHDLRSDRLRPGSSTSSARPSSKATSTRCAAKAWSRPSTQMRTMVSKYMDPGIAGRDYDAANIMLGQGKAAFFIMGDWEIGTLQAAGFKPGTDILCGQAPTDWGKPGFILNSDSVVFFTQKDPGLHRGPEAACAPDPVARLPGRSSTRPRARSRRASTSTSPARAGMPASRSRRRTCRPRSPPARWCARWPTT